MFYLGGDENRRIVVVGDEEQRKLVFRLLAEIGFSYESCLEFGEAALAIKAMEDVYADIVFYHVPIGSRDGLSLFAELGEKVVTIYSEGDDPDAAVLSGDDACVIGPLDSEKLKRALSEIV
ncbi:MAG: hypothetical protein KJ592_03420 [Nanoarchaeota archaeon]|nr:hypothetical protein [Nanoarchaeota archaeon]